MKINSLNTLGIANSLRKTSSAIARSLERLSSGSRLSKTSASDSVAVAKDATLESQRRGITQGIRNLNDMIAFNQIASASLQSQLDILQRMREIAVQGGNATLSTSDRSALTSEMTQLYSEYNRISLDTEFNGNKVLDGSLSSLSASVGSNANSTISFNSANTSSSRILTKNIGSGVFTKQASYSIASGSTNTGSVVAKDFNNDGNVDLLSGENTNGTYTLLLGKGDGTFYQKSTGAIATGVSQNNFSVADVNNDGILDFAVAESASSVAVALGNGDGTFAARKTISIGSTTLNDVTLADFNSDGKVDLVTSDSTAGNISVLFGNGDGSFAARNTFTLSSPGQLKAADMNGDGKLDIVSRYNTGLNILLNNGNGTFAVSATLSTVIPNYDFQIGDINGDGALDIVAATASFVGVGINNGSGGSFTATTIASAPYSRLALTDVNGDGTLDIVGNLGTAVGADGDYVHLGNGNGTFATRSSSGLVESILISGYDMADFNNDGVLDLAVVNAYLSSEVSIRLQRAVTASAASDLNVSSTAKAKKLLGILDSSLSKMQTAISQTSANQLRLERAAESSENSLVPLSEAIDQNRSIDIAQEVADLTRNQILQQVQVAALGQANLQLQVVLNLFK